VTRLLIVALGAATLIVLTRTGRRDVAGRITLAAVMLAAAMLLLAATRSIGGAALILAAAGITLAVGASRRLRAPQPPPATREQ
jgi:hypothetical protein